MTTRVTVTADGSTAIFSVPFPYLDRTHVKVMVNGVALETTAYSWVTSASITLTPAPAAGAKVTIYRETPSAPLTIYQSGSVLTRDQLEVDSLQALYRTEEAEGVALRLPSDHAADTQLPPLVPLAPLVVNSDATGVEMGSTALTGDMLLRPDLASTAAGKGTSLVGYLLGLVGSVGRTLKSKLDEWISPKDFGAVGNAVTDDTAAVQAMFDAAAGITANPDYVQGALVQLPPGSFGISDTITLTRPPMVIGAGYAERSLNALGDGRGITQFVALPGLAGKPMFRIVSDTPNEYVHGGKFLYVNLLGMNLASYGIWGSSMSHCDFDVRAFRFTTAGIRSDDGNGVLSDRNTFDLHYVAGTSGATENSHALWIKGDNAGAAGTGNPQNIVRRLDGLVKHGDGLRLEGDVDNTVILHTAVAVAPGGTGRNVAYIATTAAPRVNFCHYSAGGLHHLDAGTYGNSFRTSSESTTFTGAGLYDLVTTDYATGGFWQTRRHYLSDRIQFSTSEFNPPAGGGAVARATNGDTNGWAFDDTADETLVTQRVIPITWRNGKITGVNLRFVMLGAQTLPKAVRWEVRLRSVSQDEAFTISNVQAASVSLTAAAANTMQLASITLGTPEAVAPGDLLILQVRRVGSHADDTATGDAMLFSVEASYVSDGPQSPGSGVIQVPPMGT